MCDSLRDASVEVFKDILVQLQSSQRLKTRPNRVSSSRRRAVFPTWGKKVTSILLRIEQQRKERNSVLLKLIQVPTNAPQKS